MRVADAPARDPSSPEIHDDHPGDKDAKLKQRNRVAQKRFRQRAKERMETLHHDVDILSAKLQQVELEKRKVEADVRQMRSEQLATSASEQQTPLPILKEAEVDFVPSVSWAGFNPAAKGSIILRVIFDTPRRLTYDQAQKLTALDHCHIWQEVVYQCGKLLLENPKEDPDSPAGRKLQELLSERRGLACYTRCWVPRIIPVLQSIDMSQPHNEKPTKRDPAFYRGVLQKLDMSERQQHMFCRAYVAIERKLEAIYSERRILQRTIEGLEISMDEVDVSCPLQNPSLVLKHTLRRLHDNIEAEHVAQCTLWAAVLTDPDGFTYFQEAKFLLSSWPFIPDMPQLYLQICEQLGERPVDSAAATASLRPPTPQHAAAASDDGAREDSYDGAEAIPAQLLRCFRDEDVTPRLYDVELSKAFLRVAGGREGAQSRATAERAAMLRDAGPGLELLANGC